MHKFAEKIVECVKSKVEAVGIDNVSCEDVKELGEWIDIAKDLTEYDKNMRTIKAMDEAEKNDEAEMREMREMMRMGYNRKRYSNGRFASRGRGHRMGYMPPMMDKPYWDDDDYMSEYLEHGPNFMSMGYSGNRGGDSGNYSGQNGNNRGGNYAYNDGGSYGYSNDNRSEGSRYGRSYDRYNNARRHYHESKDAASEKEMDDTFESLFETFGEMSDDVWGDLTSQQKAKYKPHINKMLQKFQKMAQA